MVIPKKRDIKLSDCDISKAKYNVLKYFCIQYEEKKRKLQRMRQRGNQLNSIYANIKSGENSEINCDENAVKCERLRKDIELIEQTAIEADSDIYQYIIKSVAEGINYEYMDVPLSRTKFYDTRRFFFYLLAQKR